ncbi:MAG: DUF932 domain-containing protein [Rhodospirillales bacterium]|nr:DUF932 domain-containing protein [Acetobacter sp.]
MRTTNLLLHCGAAKVERDWLALMAAPRSTDTWFPISHERLVREVETALDRAGMRVVGQAHGLSPDARRYFGLLQVAAVEPRWTTPQPPTQDYTYVLGLRNSHDKRFSAAMVLGSQVFVCDNLAFSGEVQIGRKHTRFIERDLPLLIAQATGRLAERWHQQDARFAAYKQTELGDAEAHDLIVRALDAHVFTATHLPDVLTQWRTPNHFEFAESRTVWRLFNAVTEAVKGSLWTLPTRTQALHALLDAHTSIHGLN